MRYSDEEYEIGQVWIEKETGERFVCISLNLCEDTYYDTVYTMSEEEFLQNKGRPMRESEIKSFNIIENYNMDKYDLIKGANYQVSCETVYNLDCDNVSYKQELDNWYKSMRKIYEQEEESIDKACETLKNIDIQKLKEKYKDFLN